MPDQPDIRALKSEAKQLMKSASVSPLRFTLLFLCVRLALDLISSAAGSLQPRSTLGAVPLPISFAAIFTMLLASVLSAGHVCYCLGVQRGESMAYDSLLDALPFAGRVIGLQLLQGLLIGTGISLFVVPGVFFALAYALSIYHLCENPDAGVVDAMRRSRLEMRGNKGRFLLLLLSYWPLLLAAGALIALVEYPLLRYFPDTLTGNLLYTLLCGLLSGVVNLFLLPQLKLALAGFYRAVKL